MYRRLNCDWFLSDSIHPRMRLDAPERVEDALITVGTLRDGMSYEEHAACEWIYRRTWRYVSDFSVPESGERVFLLVSGIRGSARIFVNGSEVYLGSGPAAEFEITSGLEKLNRIELAFEPDSSFSLRPDFGFDGAVMYRVTGSGAITAFNARPEGIFTALDLREEKDAELKYSLCSPRGNAEAAYTEHMNAGYTPVLRQPFDGFEAGEANTITVGLMIDGSLSDEMNLTYIIPRGVTAGRGFVCDTESLMGLCENAGGNTAFTLAAEPGRVHYMAAARHCLASASLDDGDAVQAPEALLPYALLDNIVTDEKEFDSPALWLMTGSRRDCFDEAALQVSDGDIEKIVTMSRWLQAKKLRYAALNARLKNQRFALAEVGNRLYSPASCALEDRPGHMRPAYYALGAAWQDEYAFTRSPRELPADGVFSCEVAYVCDGDAPVGREIKLTSFDIEGRVLASTRYPALENGIAGRFTVEIPESGCVTVRTCLMDGDETVTVSDETLLLPGTLYDRLPQTQVLIGNGRVTNVGSVTALNVCVPGAGYLGCLLPGEGVSCGETVPEEIEGLNIYF